MRSRTESGSVVSPTDPVRCDVSLRLAFEYKHLIFSFQRWAGAPWSFHFARVSFDPALSRPFGSCPDEMLRNSWMPNAARSELAAALSEPKFTDCFLVGDQWSPPVF